MRRWSARAVTNPYGYLVKPFSERELHATITMALERRDERRRRPPQRGTTAPGSGCRASSARGKIDADTGPGPLQRVGECDELRFPHRTRASADRRQLPGFPRRPSTPVTANWSSRPSSMSTRRNDLCEVEFRHCRRRPSRSLVRVIGKTFAKPMASGAGACSAWCAISPPIRSASEEQRRLRTELPRPHLHHRRHRLGIRSAARHADLCQRQRRSGCWATPPPNG